MNTKRSQETTTNAIMKTMQDQLDRIEEKLDILLRQSQPTNQTTLYHDNQQSIPRPTQTIERVKNGIQCNKQLAVAITRVVVREAIEQYILPDVHTLPFTSRAINMKKNKIIASKKQHASNNCSDNEAKSAIIYDMLRGIAKKVCESEIQLQKVISYQALSDTTKGRLQHELNKHAKDDGIHIGRAEGDWIANHFIGNAFGNAANVQTKYKTANDMEEGTDDESMDDPIPDKDVQDSVEQGPRKRNQNPRQQKKRTQTLSESSSRKKRN
ncbi:unnamed protein product [Absidia cylindrospora]